MVRTYATGPPETELHVIAKSVIYGQLLLTQERSSIVTAKVKPDLSPVAAATEREGAGPRAGTLLQLLQRLSFLRYGQQVTEVEQTDQEEEQ